jgi:hypothetical protein
MMKTMSEKGRNLIFLIFKYIYYNSEQAVLKGDERLS